MLALRFAPKLHVRNNHFSKNKMVTKGYRNFHLLSTLSKTMLLLLKESKRKNILNNTIHSNVLIAPCSTADPSIAGAVLLQNKPNTKIERLIILD